MYHNLIIFQGFYTFWRIYIMKLINDSIIKRREKYT
nr:MAG TPA: Protein trafficking PGA2 [Caudoviricetes sp.]